MLSSGDVILAQVQFADTFEVKSRPAVVLFEEFGNVVIAGITSNLSMKGIRLTKKDGAIKESVIKTNYIFTISEAAVKKKLFALGKERKSELYDDILGKISGLR